MECRARLLVGVVLMAQLCRCTADAGGGHGFSVEFIHRDSPKSLFPSDVENFYTVVLESIVIGNKTFTLPNTTHLILDSGTTLTYLDKGLFDPMVEELTRSIKLPRVASPVDFMPLCYDVTGITLEWVLENIVPDVKLGLGGGAVVTMKAQNMFVRAQEWTICMAVVATTEDQPVGITGNVAQQDMHVG